MSSQGLPSFCICWSIIWKAPYKPYPLPFKTICLFKTIGPLKSHRPFRNICRHYYSIIGLIPFRSNDDVGLMSLNQFKTYWSCSIVQIISSLPPTRHQSCGAIEDSVKCSLDIFWCKKSLKKYENRSYFWTVSYL